VQFIRFKNDLFIYAEAKKLAGYLFVCIEDKTIFLAQRGKNETSDPNLWEGLGGHVEKGESIEQAAKREVIEEGGSFPKCNVIKSVVNKKNDDVEYTLFIANLTAAQKKNWKPKLNKEHQDAKWFSKLPNDTHPELIKELELLV